MTDAANPAASLDGGDLDCGGGLLLLLRKAIDPLAPGEVLQLFSTESSVEADLPAWCRLTGNPLQSVRRDGARTEFRIAKKPAEAPADVSSRPRPKSTTGTLRTDANLEIPSFAVMGVGSWPRPNWLLRMLHERLAGRLPEADFQAAADDAVRLAAAAQTRAGVDVLTDGEQRRDNYASFVGRILDNCQLVPIADLAAYVDDPERFVEELRALEVPAHEVRHPAVFGKLGRSKPLAVDELVFLRAATDRPVKIALPGPYLLTRTMWMECISDRAYPSREELAADIVGVLREELADLLAAGAALVQFDEPVLTEAAFARHAPGQRSFMCGALGEKRPVAEELAFAQALLQDVLRGFPQSRTALHVCRGNWSKNEAVALAGDYRPLVPLLAAIPVGHYLLELCTPRAGELEVLRGLPDDRRIGVGVVNQKLDEVESVEAVLRRGRAAANLFGVERVTFNPDCGFATFADAPLAAAEIAEAKMRVVRQAADRLREEFAA